MFSGRPVRNVSDMAFDFDGDDYLDPAEEAELERYLDDNEDEDNDFDEDLEDEDNWDIDDDDLEDLEDDDW